MKRLSSLALCLGILMVLAGVITADEPTTAPVDPNTTTAITEGAPVEETADPAIEAPRLDVMRVFLDPESGGLRPPTAAERRAMNQKASGHLQNALSRSSEGLVEEKRADGTVGIHLQGRFQTVSVARINADGDVVKDCAVSPETAAELLEGKAPMATEKREEQ